MLDLLFVLPVVGVAVDFRLVCERCDFRVPLEETDREPEPPVAEKVSKAHPRKDKTWRRCLAVCWTMFSW